MNSFDAVVYVALIAAVVLGFNSGLLRSAVTILAYLFAMPIAIWAMSFVAPAIKAIRHGRRIGRCSLAFFWLPAWYWEN
jgi:membrane protein required for colicin V production